MRKSTVILAGVSALALIGAPSAAQAATFVFSTGNYMPGTTSPSPLLAPDVLNITGGSNKFFDGVTFTNQSGTVDWNGGALFFSNGAVVNNQSLWDTSFDGSLNYNGGAAVAFNNSGTFRKSAGAGITTIGGVGFVNSGTIDAQTGTISFAGASTFNAGSSFTGSGVVAINTVAAFNGAISSTNLAFASGSFTGNAASLTGNASWSSGSFSGGWNLTNGSTLTSVGGSNRFMDAATFTNDGTINWQDASALFLSNASQLTNNGTIDYAASSSLNNNGGAVSTVTNSATGLVRNDAGTSLTIGNRFVNDGGTLTADGTINFSGGNAVFNDGTSFNGAGVNAINTAAAFNGDIGSTNLRFNNGVFSGTSAVLDGDATFAAGTFSGGWNLTSGSTLTAATGSNRFMDAASFTNDGTIAWQDASALFLSNASQLTNNGTIDYAASSSLNNNGGAVSTVTNSATGLVRNDAGTILTVGNRFVNDGGTVTADGTINFSGGNAVFNDGTSFNGAGVNAINNSAAFNGGIGTTNLRFNGGVFTGTNAMLDGEATWAAGTFTGDWALTNGSTLSVVGGSNRFLAAANVTNNGTIVWQEASAVFLSDGSQLVNNGTIDFQVDASVNYNGGATTAFTNNGLIEKTGGTGTTTLSGSGITFDNEGTINVLSGTIALPGAFTNDGTLGGTGRFTSTNLLNAGSIAPGAPGATGSLLLTGNFTQAASGQLSTQLASSGSADLFNISGTAALGGTLSLSCILGCAIDDGDSFVILDSVGALSGTFANITTTGFLNGFSYDLVYDYDADLVRLTVLDAGTAGVVPEPASWAMMIAGFALAGMGARRRRTNIVSA